MLGMMEEGDGDSQSEASYFVDVAGVASSTLTILETVVLAAPRFFQPAAPAMKTEDEKN